MFLNEEDIEIQIILKKFNLSESKGADLTLILQHYFLNNYNFPEAVSELIKITNLPIGEAKIVILTGGLLYLEKVEPEKKEEIKELLENNQIDIEKIKAELEEIRLEILTPRDISYLDINEREEALDIFKNFLKEALLSDNDENKSELNDRIILMLFSEGMTFKTELEKAIFANQQIIGEEIEIDNKKEPPTIANWLQDFIRFGIIEKGMDFDKAQYFTQSTNFQKLNSVDKELVAKLLDLYWQLKFFPQSLEKLPVDDWYLVPYGKKLVEPKVTEIKKPPRTLLRKGTW